jgi:metal transporter CNNM
MSPEVLAWLIIGGCLILSALFSGLTIGLFGISRLRLEVQADAGRRGAQRILCLRRDANFLLAALLWANVGVNVLIALLTQSLLTGVGAFLFSTVCITVFGEILPQAFFARHALRAGPFFVPLVRITQTLLFPVAKPTALLLDRWLGKESVNYFKEDELRFMLMRHIRSNVSDLGRLESLGALNFIALDDLLVEDEGEPVDPSSVIPLPVENGRPVFPALNRTTDDPFLRKVHACRKKWVIVTDMDRHPLMALDTDQFLLDALFGTVPLNPYVYCHRPILVREKGTRLGEVIRLLQVIPQHTEDDVIDKDIILFWGATPRIMTGADILGRLLRGIVVNVNEKAVV